MKKRWYSFLLAILLLAALAVPALAKQAIPEERQLPLLVDNADLLSEEEETALLAQLEDISERQECEVAVVTVESLEGKTSTQYADDFYDYNGYGYGANKDGILLLISMEDRDWAISTYGYGITAFTDAGQEYLMDQVLPALRDGDYAEAFSVFAEQCDVFLTQAADGEPYDGRNIPQSNAGSDIWMHLGISLVFGLIVSLVLMLYHTGRQKGIRSQPDANEYLKEGSLDVTHSRDLFLFRTVHRTRRPEENRGSSTHTSSSGRTHGGSSGHF